MVWCLWARRASSVVTSEMPTLPLMLRARLMSPVALFMRSFGTNEKAVTLMGTKRKASAPREMVHTRTNVQKPVVRFRHASHVEAFATE